MTSYYTLKHCTFTQCRIQILRRYREEVYEAELGTRLFSRHRVLSQADL